MKKISYILFFWLVLTTISFQTINSDKIDINNLNEERLEQLIIEQVNILRKRKRLSGLERDSTLVEAAKDQANYLKQLKKLTHSQPSKNKNSSLDRVDYYGGGFNYVGENVAYTFYNKEVYNARFKTEIVVLDTYKKMASHFFYLWKNSKPHYRNMIDKEFKQIGIRFSYDTTNQRIYGVQVFGARE